ncbi:hypothetical protein AJ80_00895 [Polytolypa hystricis UAMH7299]|uniref:Uncharacterized protein n=1 Tax=Polytolypa hystricis (strain UAMH7299) TaxID=1447883 RepID=A0A2B7Z3M2_POLH7|nr:hypothetical protein AJ80_00895 [Polytolypa hystricis UAMH7299]
MSTANYDANPPFNTDDHEYIRDLRIHRPHSHGSIIDKLSPSQIPILSPRYGAKPRSPFSRTKTLTNAFQATGNEQTGGRSGQKTPPKRTMSRGRKTSITSLMSEVSSPPPGELIETYRRINDADSLADFVAQDDYEVPYDQARAADRIRHHSPSPGARRYEMEADAAGNAYDSDMSFLEDVSDDSLREKLARHQRDEARLKRATRREAPVFSKGKAGLTAAFAIDSLQRRAEEEQEDEEKKEAEHPPEPPINIPRTWGERGRVSKDWLSVSRVNGNGYPKHDSPPPPVHDWENDLELTARSLEMSKSPPVRNSVLTWENTQSPMKPNHTTRETDGIIKEEPDEHIKPSTEVNLQISNTPALVQKSSSMEKPKLKPMANFDSLFGIFTRSKPDTSTPKQNQADHILNAKTPKAPGAYIETPLTKRVLTMPKDLTKDTAPPKKQPPQPKRQPQKPTVKQEETKKTIPPSKPQAKPARPIRRILEKPKLPENGVKELIEKVRSGEESDLLLGEDTINSLLADGSSFLELTRGIQPENGDETTDNTKDLNLPVKTNEATIDRITVKLQSLVRNIHETRSGLTSLENSIPTFLSAGMAKEAKNDKGPHRHTTTPCDECGLYGDGRSYVAIPLPRLWHRHPTSNHLRPTRLGWITLLFCVWLITELTMCEYYCHPLYAEGYEGYGVDPNAPHLPFVLPTMLWRWSHLSIILKPLWVILVALFRFLAQLFGFWDGFVDSPPLEPSPWPDAGILSSASMQPSATTTAPPVLPTFAAMDVGADLGIGQDELV